MLSTLFDWNYLFGRLGVLERDTQIASAVRMIGWLGMIGIVIWLIWRGINDLGVKSPQMNADEHK